MPPIRFEIYLARRIQRLKRLDDPFNLFRLLTGDVLLILRKFLVAVDELFQELKGVVHRLLLRLRE